MSVQPVPSTDAPRALRDHPLALRAGALQRRYPLLQLVALVVLFEYGVFTVVDFATKQSILSMLVAASLLGLSGAGQTLVVLVGGIDFSIPGFIAAAAIIVCELTGTHGWPFLAALALILALAAALGAANGYISHRFRVQPLVVTLGMSSIVTGAVLVWTNAQPTGTAPGFLTRISSVSGTTFGIGVPPVVFIWAAVAILLGVVLRRTLMGRRVYATGSNPGAAELALVRTRRVWVGAYAASAVLAAALGVLLAGYTGSGNITLGDPYLWQGLAAVIVGGTAFGARGDYWRTVLGALILTVLTTVMIGHGLDDADQQIIFGVLILLVVAGYARDSRLRDRI
jgi:ribose transport system permease protein